MQLLAIFMVLLLVIVGDCSPLSKHPTCEDQCNPETLTRCEGNRRCVYNGKCYACFEMPAQDPRCPEPSNWGYCTDGCSHNNNYNCKTGFICCFNGCGNYCYKP